MSNLSLALHSAKSTAEHHGKQAKACAEIASVIEKAMETKPPQFDIEAMAKGLLDLGICVVHRDVVKEMIAIVEAAEWQDSEEAKRLIRLERALKLAQSGAVK